MSDLGNVDDADPVSHGAPEGAFALETSSVALPDPFQAAYGASEPPPRGLFPAVRAGISHAWRSKKALMFVLVVQLFLGLTIAVPLESRLRGHMESHAHAPAMAGEPDAIDDASKWDAGLDWGVWADIKRKEAPFLDGLSLALVWVLIAAWAFGAFVAGGFLSTAAALRTWTGRYPASASFMAGGGRWFGPMFRMSLCFAAFYYVVGRIVFEVWNAHAVETEGRTANGAVQWWGLRTREAAFAVAFLILRATADLGRARLVAFERKSAVLAYFRGFLSFARHPIRVGGLALLAGILEMLLFLGCMWVIGLVPGGKPFPDLIVVFLVLQLAVLVRWWSRVVVLAGNVHLLRAHAAARM